MDKAKVAVEVREASSNMARALLTKDSRDKESSKQTLHTVLRWEYSPDQVSSDLLLKMFDYL